MTVQLSRRRFLGCSCTGAVGLMGAVAMAGAFRIDDAFAAEPAAVALPSPGEVLAMLKSGNADFVSDAPYHGALGQPRRLELAKAQHPLAVVICCSDSRVPPELLFGRGLGELFVVRNAGNTVDQLGLGSIEYAVEHLGTPLIVVLGHQRCGAVSAAVSVVKDGTDIDGAIGDMVDPIIPAVLAVRDAEGDLVDNAVRQNVRRTVTSLRKSTETVLSEKLREKKLLVVGAEYSLDNGAVDFFDEA